MSDAVFGWLRHPLVDPTPVHDLRGALYRWLGEPSGYRIDPDPHLSLFGFAVPESEAEAFERAVDHFANALGRCPVPIEGYRAWPSTRNPMVVALDARVALDAAASPLADLLAAHGGRVRWRSEAPHVTLFKSERGARLQWPQIDEAVRANLRALVDPSLAGDDAGPDAPPEDLVDPDFDLTARPPAIEWH